MLTLGCGLLNVGDDLSRSTAEHRSVVAVEDPHRPGQGLIFVALEPPLLGTTIGRLLALRGWTVAFDPREARAADRVRAVMANRIWTKAWPELAQELTVLLPEGAAVPMKAEPGPKRAEPLGASTGSLGEDALARVLGHIGRPDHTPSRSSC